MASAMSVTWVGRWGGEGVGVSCGGGGGGVGAEGDARRVW